ncbi:MAG: arsenate reductase [Candidatus Nitrosothermus koennekii]|nr:MAG: arsenate reductase [Candidatus Nitrosothermus koennekii]
MSKIKVYYYNRCQTCRKTIDKLKKEGEELELREFFKDRLTKEEIKQLLKMANISPKDALRKRDKMYKELGLDKKDYDDEHIIELMVKYPSLIARPIIIKDGKAFIREIKS